MVKDLVLRGALAGLAGGLVAWVFALVFAEPMIGAAIDYESGRSAAEAALSGSPPPEEMELFSRGVQSTVGVGVGIVALGVAMGLFVAIAYSMVHGRVALRPRALALVVALLGFVAVYATPFVKYPANPPAVGHEETIGDRSGLYLIMVIASVVLAVAAVLVARRLAPRLGTFNAVLVAILGYVVLVGVVMALLPALGELTTNVAENGPQPTETPLPLRNPAGQIVYPGFDADVLYDFRLYSIAAQALLWSVLGLVFGALAERLTARGAAARETATTAGAAV